MKDLIRKILKESEDDLGWVQELSNEVKNAIILGKNEEYIVDLCSKGIKPDKIRYKFDELYGKSNIDEGVNESLINLFDNNFMDRYIDRGQGFIIYIHPEGETISTGWYPCSSSVKEREKGRYRILTLEEFLLVMIES